jgi:hypothetical protein
MVQTFRRRAGLLFEIYTSIGNRSSETFRKYSTFLELNCQSILLGRYNTPLTLPSFLLNLIFSPLSPFPTKHLNTPPVLAKNSNNSEWF